MAQEFIIIIWTGVIFKETPGGRDNCDVKQRHHKTLLHNASITSQIKEKQSNLGKRLI